MKKLLETINYEYELAEAKLRILRKIKENLGRCSTEPCVAIFPAEIRGGVEEWVESIGLTFSDYEIADDRTTAYVSFK
ncbi:hypothetical protein [Methylobacter tundripaludum]